MTTFDMNNATDIALKMDVYAICLRKSRADLEAEKLAMVRLFPGTKIYLQSLLIEKDFI